MRTVRRAGISKTSCAEELINLKINFLIFNLFCFKTRDLLESMFCGF